LQYQFTTANAKLASFQEKHVVLQRQFEMWKFFCQRETKKCFQCEVTFVNIEVDCLKMEDVIIDVKHEVLVLQVEKKVVCKQLEDMENKSATSLWPKPIVIPCRITNLKPTSW